MPVVEQWQRDREVEVLRRSSTWRKADMRAPLALLGKPAVDQFRAREWGAAMSGLDALAGKGDIVRAALFYAKPLSHQIPATAAWHLPVRIGLKTSDQHHVRTQLHSLRARPDNDSPFVEPVDVNTGHGDGYWVKNAMAVVEAALVVVAKLVVVNLV